MSNRRRLRKPPGADADVADAAELAVRLLRLAAAVDRDGMVALADEFTGRPDVLGSVAVMMTAEVAALGPGEGFRDVLARFERVAAQFARPGG
jgi:hypothetical protein